jgi:nucleoside-diphosphate-sugar epimerase
MDAYPIVRHARGSHNPAIVIKEQPMSPPQVLVLGGRGRFGLAAAQAFAQAGWQVTAQVRPGAADLPVIANVRWLQARPCATASLASAAAGAGIVVQALSPVYTHAAWRRDVPALTQVAIDVTRALGATLMLPASVYNFGAAMPPRLLEDTPQQATTFKGRLRMASERMIEDATRDGRMRAVVIRAGDFFGSGRGGWLDLVIAKELAAGRVTYPGALDVPTAWAYLPDLARGFVAAARERAQWADFETLHFAGYSLTGADWLEALAPIAREQGWVAPGAGLRVRSLSWPLVGLAGLAVPTLRAVHEMRYLWRTPHALVNRRMQAVTGPEPRTPFPEALRAALGDIGLAMAQPCAARFALS